MAFVFLACGKRSDPPPRQEPPPLQDARRQPAVREGWPSQVTQPPLSALLDVQGGNEAIVVAVVGGGTWQAPFVAGKQVVAQLAKRGAAYQVFPAGAAEAAVGSGNGTLAGNVREDCGDFFLDLAAPATTQGFAAVSTSHMGGPAAAVSLRNEEVRRRDAASVAAVIEHAAKIKVAPKIERAYQVDLDGNGKPETILQATHPDLLGDPPKYKRQYYSLVVVLPDGDGEPSFAGYLQAAKEFATFQVLAVDSVADVDHDGKRELLVRARHAEGWQTQVFRYEGNKLKELFRSVGGEGQCPGTGGGGAGAGAGASE